MGTADILQMVSFAAFISAGIFLVLTVIFFFSFRIPKVAGELSGKSAKRSIRRIRETNEKSMETGFQRAAVNRNRGMLTETVPAGTRQEHELSNRIFYETGILDENEAHDTDMSLEETAFLDERETTPLYDRETTLSGAAQAGDFDENTTELAGPGLRLEIIDEVKFVHTNEVLDL